MGGVPDVEKWVDLLMGHSWKIGWNIQVHKTDQLV